MLKVLIYRCKQKEKYCYENAQKFAKIIKISPLRREGTNKRNMKFVFSSLSGSGLPWRDCFEYAWVTLNRSDRRNKGIHIWSRSGPGVQRSGLKKSRQSRIKGIVSSSCYKSVSLNGGAKGIPDLYYY